jgi:hypothetical protein
MTLEVKKVVISFKSDWWQLLHLTFFYDLRKSQDWFTGLPVFQFPVLRLGKNWKFSV